MSRHRNETKQKLHHLAAHVDEETYQTVKALAEREDRSVSYMSKILLLKGLAVIEGKDTK